MHLDPINRLPVVLKKITEEIENQNASIIILQEVSHDWAGTFHKFFANHGYHMVTGLYGKTFNGYMGVATCFKLSDYSVVDVDISRLADKREAGWPRKQVSKHKLSNIIFQGLYNKWYSCVASAMKSLFSLFKRNKNQRRIVDSWSMSEN